MGPMLGEMREGVTGPPKKWKKLTIPETNMAPDGSMGGCVYLPTNLSRESKVPPPRNKALLSLNKAGY